jgi:hypothetical protein
MPVVEAQIASKIRDVQAGKLLHDKLFDQLKAKELELQFERASVAARYEVMDPPAAFELNLTTSTLKRAAVGSLGGVFLGILFALLHWFKTYVQKHRTLMRAPSSTRDIQVVRPESEH